MINQNPAIMNAPATSTPITSSIGYFQNLSRVLAAMPHTKVEQVADKLYQAYESGRGVFVFGNGGSASLASHFACDMSKGTSLDGQSMKRFRVMSLTDNLPLLTAWANDVSYDQIFAEQIRNLAQRGDVAFAISGSGNSANVLLGLQAAREAGAFTIGLGGFQGGKMKPLCDLSVVVPSHNMQIIEDLHVSVSHALFTLVRNRIEMRVANARAAAASAR